MSTFRIAGQIIASGSKKPLVGLRVEAWDKDHIFNDFVGSTVSDEKGSFQMEFNEGYFHQLFFGRRPDFYFKLFYKDRLVKDTKDHFQSNAVDGYNPVVIEVDRTAFGKPRRKELHTLKEHLSEPSSTSAYEPSRLLKGFILAMNATGQDAKDRYDHALDALCNDAEQVLPEIERVLQSTPQQDFLSRWVLIYTAVKMKHPSTLLFLKNLVLAPLSLEEPSPLFLGEETMLRTTAIEGIEYLAISGNEDALQALFQIIEEPSRSIRIAAVQGILATPEGELLRDRVAEILPEEHRFMLDIKRMDVRDVPQINDPQRFLKPGVLATTPNPPPLIEFMLRTRPQATGQIKPSPEKGKE
jgi:hypothetical protein